MTVAKHPWTWLIAAAVVIAPIWALAADATDGGCPCHQQAASEAGATCPGHPDGGRPGHRGAGAHAGMPGRHWDAKTVTQVQGAIEEVQSGPRGHGVHLLLAVGTEKLQVMVGPALYLEQQGLKLAQGDVLEVKGSRITRGDDSVLVAQELTKGGQVVTLRDADGTPRWAGHRE